MSNGKTAAGGHRQWRGAKDTAYDFSQWLAELGTLLLAFAKVPVRTVRGIFQYRWLASFMCAPMLIGRLTEGLTGPALRVAHIQLRAVLSVWADCAADILRGDRRFDKSSLAEKQVIFDQTMGPDILSGFPHLHPIPLEAMAGLVGAWMDESLPARYMTASRFDLPDDVCAVRAITLAAAAEDELPLSGGLLILNNMPCGSSAKNNRFIGEKLGIPSYTASLPLSWDDPHTDRFALYQMKRLIRAIEDASGDSFDEPAFFDTVARRNDEVVSEREQWEYMASPYSPFDCACSELFRITMYVFSRGRAAAIRKAQRKVLDIAAKSYEQRIICFPKARHRMLLQMSSAFIQLPRWLYNYWGVHAAVQADNFEGAVPVPEDGLDSALTAIAKSYEHGIMCTHAVGGYEQLLTLLSLAERFSCDMLLLERAEVAGYLPDIPSRYSGIHVFAVSGAAHGLDSVKRQISSYMAEVMHEKPLEP